MQNISCSISSVLKHVDIWQRKHATSISKSFQSIFNDVEEPMSDSDSEEDYFEQSSDELVDMINDQSFLELQVTVDSVVEDKPHDNMHDDEPAYSEFLDSVISDINVE